MTPIQIYIGNDLTRDQAEMPEPQCKYVHGNANIRYLNHLAILPRHKVIGPHSWKVGQRLELDVDFKKGIGATIIEGYPTSPEVVIIPIEGEQEEIYHFTKDQLYQIVSQAMRTALADDFLTPREFIDKKVPALIHPKK